MEDLTILTMLTLILSFLILIMKQLYKSKCSECSFCGIIIKRNVDLEIQERKNDIDHNIKDSDNELTTLKNIIK
jgi:hypothetical protein